MQSLQRMSLRLSIQWVVHIRRVVPWIRIKENHSFLNSFFLLLAASSLMRQNSRGAARTDWAIAVYTPKSIPVTLLNGWSYCEKWKNRTRQPEKEREKNRRGQIDSVSPTVNATFFIHLETTPTLASLKFLLFSIDRRKKPCDFRISCANLITKRSIFDFLILFSYVIVIWDILCENVFKPSITQKCPYFSSIQISRNVWIEFPPLNRR